MSVTPEGAGREPGAVRVDPDQATLGGADAKQHDAADVEREAQASRVEAAARTEQIHAEVARTDVRRAEEEVAEAERREREARSAEEEARRHEAEVRRDAEDAASRAPADGTAAPRIVPVTRGLAADPGEEPIVFGPFTAERPELLVVAAFVGGFVLAKIIRKWAG